MQPSISACPDMGNGISLEPFFTLPVLCWTCRLLWSLGRFGQFVTSFIHSREDVVPVFARDGTEPISCNPHASSVPPQDGKESRDSRMLPRTASTAAEGRGGRVRGKGRATASDQNRISRLGHWDMVCTVLNPNGLTTMFGSSETIPGVVTPPVKLPKQLT